VLLVKGDHVSFILSDGREACPPARHGLMHDVDGPGPKMIPRNVFLIGPFTRGAPASDKDVSWEAEKYLGRGYEPKKGHTELPDRAARFSADGWTFQGLVKRIYYMRTGDLRVYMKHDFKNRQFIVIPVSTKLYRRGQWFRLQLPVTARINERGFIAP
jgi:hypothetical protein